MLWRGCGSSLMWVRRDFWILFQEPCAQGGFGSGVLSSFFLCGVMTSGSQEKRKGVQAGNGRPGKAAFHSIGRV